MNPISQSIKLILIHSKVFLIVISIFLIFSIGILLTTDMTDIESLLAVAQVSLFLGVFLGGGLTSLKKSYLWKNNTVYKNSNLSAFFLIILGVNALLVITIYPNITLTKLTLLMPFCISVFASQMVIGKNILYKILTPSIPFLLLLLQNYGIDLNTILMLIVASTVVLIVSMYKNVFYSFGSNQGVENKSSANIVAFMTTGLNSAQLNSINNKIGQFTAKWIHASKKKLDWAVLMPHTCLAVIALFYVLAFAALLLVSNNKALPLMQIISIVFLLMLMISIIIESRHLIKQTKMFSHVYKGINHRQLRNKILKVLDKNLTINIVVYLVGLFIIVKIFSIAVLAKTLVTLLLFSYLFSLSIYPLLMCLNWVNISLTLIGIMFLYVFTLYESIKWITVNISLALSPKYIIIFILACIIIRAITQCLFWNRSIEALMKDS